MGSCCKYATDAMIAASVIDSSSGEECAWMIWLSKGSSSGNPNDKEVIQAMQGQDSLVLQRQSTHITEV